jgi:hypothetical protein
MHHDSGVCFPFRRGPQWEGAGKVAGFGRHGEQSKKKNPMNPFDCRNQSRGLIHVVEITIGWWRRYADAKMHKHIEQYRAQAEQCRQLATLAPKADDKAFWLRLAENWARLAELVADIGRLRT